MHSGVDEAALTPVEQEQLSLYLFDCIALAGQSLTQYPFIKRYKVCFCASPTPDSDSANDFFSRALTCLYLVTQRLKAEVVGPYLNCQRMTNRLPIQVVLKSMENAFALDKVLKVDIPRMMHGIDGLVFTRCQGRYFTRTDSMTCVLQVLLDLFLHSTCIPAFLP